MRILLASASPRRADLLARAGFEFDVAAAHVDETRFAGEPPSDYVIRVADAKAAAVAARHPGCVVLGADTVVVVEGVLFGKPRDDAEAAEMLRALSGRCHEVLTGVALRAGARRLVAADLTRVGFVELSPEQIAWYVGTGEPRGKAGAYAVQGLGSRFVDRLEGSYSNVVGLPIWLVDRLLREIGAQSLEPRS